jgi:hypothetical protein
MECEGTDVSVGLEIMTGNHHKVKISDLNLVPVSLGFVNVKGDVGYVSRKPIRREKQGLSRDSLCIKSRPLNGKDEGNPFALRMGRQNNIALDGEPLAKTILGTFPNLVEAVTSVRTGKTKASAFSRNWAIGKDDVDLCLLYRGDVVGFVGDTSVKLLPEFSFLKESLEMELV